MRVTADGCGALLDWARGSGRVIGGYAVGVVVMHCWTEPEGPVGLELGEFRFGLGLALDLGLVLQG